MIPSKLSLEVKPTKSVDGQIDVARAVLRNIPMENHLLLYCVNNIVNIFVQSDVSLFLPVFTKTTKSVRDFSSTESFTGSDGHIALACLRYSVTNTTVTEVINKLGFPKIYR